MYLYYNDMWIGCE